MVKKKSLLSTKLIEGILQQAETLVIYKNALVEKGMSEQDALRMTIAYQGQQMEAAFKVNIEEKKMMMSLKDQGKVIN